jgi:hypothetical protein
VYTCVEEGEKHFQLILKSKLKETGPELPFGIFDSQMVEDQNGGCLLD